MTPTEQEAANLNTLRANLGHAIRNHESVTIGGGTFSGAELQTLQRAVILAQNQTGAACVIPDRLVTRADINRTLAKVGSALVTLRHPASGDYLAPVVHGDGTGRIAFYDQAAHQYRGVVRSTYFANATRGNDKALAYVSRPSDLATWLRKLKREGWVVDSVE